MGGSATRDTQGWPPESVLDAGDADEADASALRNTPGERWYECERCGQLFAESDTAIETTTNLRVCTTGPNDFDRVDPDDIRLLGTSRLFLPEEST